MTELYYSKNLGDRNFKAVQEALNALNERLRQSEETVNSLRQEINRVKVELAETKQQLHTATALAYNGGSTVRD